jgi:anti-anti-sigma regulatory factor
MWQRRGHRSDAGPATDEPYVVTVTDSVTRDRAPELVERVERLAGMRRVVLDLTAITDFDTDGVSAVSHLQESLGEGRLTVLGLRQATARIVGVEEPVQPRPTAAPEPRGPWVVRRLRAITVVQAVDVEHARTNGMEEALTAALEQDVAIVVLDLRGVALDPAAIEAIAFASSTAAVNGQELLIVNVEGDGAEALRRTALSASTYLAPEPIQNS